MTCAPSNVVRIRKYLASRPRQKTQYERYPLPFFHAKRRCTWDVAPTGDYAADCKTGSAYAVEFLKSCDGTVGWSCLLSNIVTDIIGAGPSGVWPDGGTRTNGIVIGFMGTIGRALCAIEYLPPRQA